MNIKLYKVLLVCLFLGACSPAAGVVIQPPTSAVPEPTTAIVQPTLSATAEQPQQPTETGKSGFIVVDALGREVKFLKTPTRIALAGRGSSLVVDALYLFPEAKERLVTIGKGSQGPENFLKVIDPGLDQKPMLPPEVSPEELLTLQPDVVILKSYNAEKLGNPLEKLGIPVVYVDFETPEQYWRDLKTLGQIFQNEARAQEITSYYQEILLKVESGLKDLKESGKPRQLLLYYSAKDGEIAFNVPPEGWIQTLLIKQAGGVPIWTDLKLEKGWTKVGLEQIAAWDADQVFIVDYTGNVDEVVKGLNADPNWQKTRAVKEGNLFAFPKDYMSWDQSDPRWILGLIWMAKTTHPDLFPDLDIAKETRLFFEKMYGIDAEEFSRSIELMIKGDFEK